MELLFDLNGTLTDVRPLTAGWTGAPPDLALQVLDDAILHATADTLTGAFRPFPELLRGALGAAAHRLGLDPAAHAAQGVEAAAALPAWPDAAQALRDVAARGHGVHVLTNSSARAARATLAEGGLLDLVETITSVEEVRQYKPAPRVYQRAVERLGVQPQQAMLVAAHWWDVLGGARAGLRTAWISRDEGLLRAGVPDPDVVAPDLAALPGLLPGG